MKVSVKPGKYIVAVSGGVDSIVLLDILSAQSGLELVVAHYDHGIRDDSAVERQLVEDLARRCGLVYATEQGNLGKQASEAMARAARYDFLERARNRHGAVGIITAHHQDDVLETMILNILRGTNRRGLSSLKSGDVIVRPLLAIPKSELLRYAIERELTWREDSTNSDLKYLRNYIRHNIMPRFAQSDREALLAINQKSRELNIAIGSLVAEYLHDYSEHDRLRRHEFIMLPHVVAREVMAEWLLLHTNVQLSKKMLERLVVIAKTGRVGNRTDINKQWVLHVDDVFLALEYRER